MNNSNKLHILLFLLWCLRSVVNSFHIGRCHVSRSKQSISTSPISLCAVNKNDGSEGGDSDNNANNNVGSSTTTTTVDVSDLGVTMDDLNAPLPQDFLQGVVTTGYESTSRIPTVQDNGCKWTETTSNTSIGGISNNDDEGEGSGTLDVTLTIPGLRGQPSAALSVQFASNTITVTAFGYIVWSAILRGEVIPESATFTTRDGEDMVPVIDVSVQKKKRNLDDERWGGFILQIGENSLL